MSLAASIRSALAEVVDAAQTWRAIGRSRMGRRGTPIDRSAPPLLMSVPEAMTLLGVNDRKARAWLESHGLVITALDSRYVHRDRLVAALEGATLDPDHDEATAPIPFEGMRREAL